VYDSRSLRATDGLLVHPGLPYGSDFTVCAISPSTNRRTVATNVDNTSYAAPGTSPTTLNMTGNTGGNACPF
jgi:hypothetical protein